MSESKFEIGDDVQMVNRRREVIIDSAIVIDVVRQIAAPTNDPSIVVKADTFGYIICPHIGPTDKSVAESDLRRRPLPGMTWEMMKIYCSWNLTD